jgi:C4-dicarboxylate-specific signal transduction histidine kinase
MARTANREGLYPAYTLNGMEKQAGVALAARDLGGSLSVHGAGAGHGATFTLELPLAPVD